MEKGNKFEDVKPWPHTATPIICIGIIVLAALQTHTFGIWQFELTQSFSVHYVWFCFGLLLTGLITGNKWQILGALVSIAIIAPSSASYIFENRDVSASAEVQISVVNIYHFNQEHEHLLPMIQGLQVDLLTILEVSETWNVKLKHTLAESHPYSLSLPSTECCYGMSFYSKLPIVEDSVYYWTQDPVIRARVVVLGKEVDVWSVHTRPPIFPNNTEERNYLMAKVAEEIKTIGKPALLAADLNIVPWAEAFQKMKTTSGMNDSRRGFLATYPMEFGIPLIPIDHIMHTEHFTTAYCKTEVIPGSDHKALVAGVSWK